MKLRELKVLTDENIAPRAVEFLRRRGLDTLTALEAGLIGATDAAVLRRATDTNRFVLTHDADFGGLAIAERQDFVGIVYVRPGHIDPEFTIRSLEGVLRRNPELRPPFVVVVRRAGDRVVIRVRSRA